MPKESEFEPRVTWFWEELTEEDRKFMKRCSRCGAWSPLASEVCKLCDAKEFVGYKGRDHAVDQSVELLAQQSPAQLPVKFCWYCAREMSSDARFCDACGRTQT